jgi:hypothetical protein
MRAEVRPPRAAKAPSATSNAAASGAWRPMREARSSSSRPASSSRRVERVTSASAMIGTKKATMKANSFAMTPPRVSRPTTRPVSIVIAPLEREAA